MEQQALMQPWFERDPSALKDLGRTLRSKYPTLHAFIEDGVCFVRGTYPVMNGDRVAKRYSLEIALPPDYPFSLPAVWETGGRIPREADRHVFPAPGCLCLGDRLRCGWPCEEIFASTTSSTFRCEIFSLEIASLNRCAGPMEIGHMALLAF